MKIAQVAPLMESVPPRLYGGTERVVSYLTDELVRLGHEVTLFASADSITAAELVGCASTALRLDSNVRDPIPYYMLMLDRVRKLAEEFDILHFHFEQLHFPLFHQMADRTVTPLHSRQDVPDLKPLYVGFDDMPLVSIPMTSGGRFPTPTTSRPCNTAFPRACTRPFTIRAAAMSRFSDEFRPKNVLNVPFGHH